MDPACLALRNVHGPRQPAIDHPRMHAAADEKAEEPKQEAEEPAAAKGRGKGKVRADPRCRHSTLAVCDRHCSTCSYACTAVQLVPWGLAEDGALVHFSQQLSSQLAASKQIALSTHLPAC